MGNLYLEQLGSRDCPSLLPGYNPNLPVRHGMRLSDIEQSSITGDCTFLASLGGSLRAGVELGSRLHRLRTFVWGVDLYKNGQPCQVVVFFNGHATPRDPVCKGGEFWVLLFARAHLKLVPQARNGESAELALGTLYGKLPEIDDDPRIIGIPAIRESVLSHKIVLALNEIHTIAVIHTSPDQVMVFDPWGIIRRMSWSRFVKLTGEVVVIGT